MNHRAISQLLPTCQRCRRLRRKCDTQLPHCQVCQKAGTECTFYDHALKQTLPRAYVQSLLNRLEKLLAVKNGTCNSLPDSPGPGPDVSDSRSQAGSFADNLQTDKPEVPVQSTSFDLVIPSCSSSGRSLYWGASSAFSLTVEILQHAHIKGHISEDDWIPSTEFDGEDDDASVDQPPYVQGQAPDADIQALVRLYLVSLNKMYGFLDQVETLIDLQSYLSLRQNPGLAPQELQGDQVHQYFRVTMMCAISCANQARYKPHRTAESFMYFSSAVACLEEVTSEASPASLQALLLLIVFCLFCPRKGDIWKLLDHACRLTIELGYHTEAENDPASTPEGESAGVRKIRRSTFWGLYAIERIVGQLFGRGSDLPETIITTEYPSVSLSGMSSTQSPEDVARADLDTVQSMSIAHHYRLVYLRSEIFRSIYLPASPPDLSLDWLKERYTTLRQWRDELAVSDEMVGVATLTCDVGYDATIFFLFQPLLLRALRRASVPTNEAVPAPEQNGAPDNDILIASDPFSSSVNLIRTYEKIIRAPETSVLGTYPMTFMSAHYIYLASCTLIAYGLLRLDGRVKFLKPMSECKGSFENEMEDLDWGVLLDASNSCLVLLGWCAERWPGMVKMLGIHQRLFGQITRKLISKGCIN